MSLRSDQTSFLATMDANWLAFRTALEDALLAGNDPTTTLADVRTKTEALHDTHIDRKSVV